LAADPSRDWEWLRRRRKRRRGAANDVFLDGVMGIDVDSAENVCIAERNRNRVRRIDPSATITTVAGNGRTGEGTLVMTGDGGPAAAAVGID
jgi:hypothetical protein